MNTATAVSPYKPPPCTDIAPPLPSSLDAERNVLGAVLIDNKAIDAAMSLNADDFFLDQHRRVFTQMVAMSERHEAIELVTLYEALQRRGDLGEVGGAAYISSLGDGMPKVSNVAHYAKIVKEKAHLRHAIRTAQVIERLAFQGRYGRERG
jgi:replicative DNA helicase